MTKAKATPAGTVRDSTVFGVTVPPKANGWTREQADQLFKLGNDRSDEAQGRRLEILRAAPNLATVVGDLARQIEKNLARDIDQGLLGDASLVHCEAMRRELGYKQSSEVERLIIDRVVLTWLHLNTLEMRRRRASQATDTPLTRVEWYDRRVSRAHNDHLRALTALARVRRLQVVIGQVNIAAGDQVNQATVIGGAAGGGPQPGRRGGSSGDG